MTLTSSSDSHTPLLQIADVAQSLSSLLSSQIPQEDSHLSDLVAPKPSLLLPSYSPQGLLHSLNQKQLSRLTVEELTSLTSVHIERLRHAYRSWWHCFWTSSSNIPARITTLILEATQRKYTTHVEELESTILRAVEDAIQRLKSEIDTATRSEAESGEEYFIARGHSRLAVTILEKAFARTANITRAEKIRLAEATKLKPRQVTIWFQNRRNRKTANNTYKYKRETTPPSSSGPKKRKVDGLYNEGARRPTQRMRSSTPENSPEMSRDVYLSSTSSSSSSSISSVDSLSYFFENRNFGSGYTYSTDSSLADDECALRKQFHTAQTPLRLSFDDQLRRPGFTSSPPRDLAELEGSDAMIFSDDGVLQLDFDDLELDLESISSDLPSFNLKDFDLVIPQSSPPSGYNTRQQNGKTGVSSPFAVPNVPTSPYDAAVLLNMFRFTTKKEVTQVQEKEGWALDHSAVIEQSGNEDDLSWFLNLQGLSPGSAASPSVQSNSVQSDTSMEDTSASSQDFFNFSVEGLFLDNIFEQNQESFQDFSGKSPSAYSIDVSAANAYPMNDAMKTAVPNRTIFE